MNSWIKKDLKYIWHPYTQMKDSQKHPSLLIERARGVKLYDEKGNFYYDTIASWWCNVHGHCHPKIKAAVRKQLNCLDHVLFAGITHRPAILLAEKLVSLTPKNLTKVFFSDNGSTAVETALKMSFQYWHNLGRKNKQKFISLDYAYHGDTIGAMSVGGVSLFNEAYKPLFFAAVNAPSPYCYRCPFNQEKNNCDFECAAALENILKEKGEEIAAIILEPLVLAAGGMIVYPPQYLSAAGKLAQKYDVHLILDEVATGFGRTGKMFACQYTEVKPDFMCLSKGLTSGVLPLAATLTTEEIYRAFYDDYEKKKTFYHGHTFTANPIACSAALESLEIFEKEGTLDRVEKLIPAFYRYLDGFREFSFAGDIRHLGLIGAIELVKDKKTKQPFLFEERIGQKIYERGLKQGLLLRPLGNIVYLFLPLCISGHDLEVILNKTRKVFESFKY